MDEAVGRLGIYLGLPLLLDSTEKNKLRRQRMFGRQVDEERIG
jgi:hypothetical protein